MGYTACSRLTSEERKLASGFWLLGLLNNAAYVIMIAGATEIDSGAVGLVYFCAIFPTILVKLTGPHWFHLVSYQARVLGVAALMSAAYLVVAVGSTLSQQLAGVALVALQGGLGEASCLALSARYPNPRLALTAWSSGTGFAGMAGYAWVAVLHDLWGLSFSATLVAAQATVAAWLLAYFGLLAPLMKQGSNAPKPDIDDMLEELEGVQLLQEASSDSVLRPVAAQPAVLRGAAEEAARNVEVGKGAAEAQGSRLLRQEGTGRGAAEEAARKGEGARQGDEKVKGKDHSLLVVACPMEVAVAAEKMSTRQRLALTAGLWPVMVPLFLVYFSEYAMQSGTWAAIGFPVTSQQARRRFYVASNWCYQGGVFLARSSGMLYQANKRQLWIMPALQAGLLAFFLLDAATHFWYNYSLLLLCFTAGLLGGAVYVNAFTLLARDAPPAVREFSLAAASIADSLGVACADVAGVLIQGCLFRWNNIPGASFKCGRR